MAINRFDKPVSSEYISQYTPIPFEQLYAIGKANNDRVDKAYQDLGTAFTKWAEFRSPSAVDTKRWYDLTIGQGQDIVNRLAANPDLIKTAAGRAEIQSFINSRPYNELSRLQQSREGMLERQKANQQLMLHDRYNPLWHDVDFTNYNTNQAGIFNDISPLPYMSERELVEPYVNNLKPGFIEQQGVWDIRGVSEARTDEQVRANLSSIYNTPQAQMYMQQYLRQGYTPEQAQALFTDRIYRAGREFAWRDRGLNPISQMDYVASLKARAAGGVDTGGRRPMRLTQSIAVSGGTAFREGTQAYVAEKNRAQLNDIMEKYNDAKANGDELTANVYMNQLRDIYKESQTYTPQKTFNSIFKDYAMDNGVLNVVGLANATNDILNRFSYPLKNTQVNDLLQTTIPGVSSDKVDTPFGKRRVIASGKDLDIATDVISNIANYNYVASGKDKVRDALKSGRLTNMIVMQGNNIITLPRNNGEEVTPYSSQIITVAIPQSQLEALGITDQDMLVAGGRRQYDTSGRTSFSADVKEDDTVQRTSTRYLTDDGTYENRYNRKGSISQSGPTEEVYWQIDLLNKVPDPTDGLNAEYLDQQAWRLSMPDSDRASLYTTTQLEAYGLDFNAGGSGKE